MIKIERAQSDTHRGHPRGPQHPALNAGIAPLRRVTFVSDPQDHPPLSTPHVRQPNLPCRCLSIFINSSLDLKCRLHVDSITEMNQRVGTPFILTYNTKLAGPAALAPYLLSTGRYDMILQGINYTGTVKIARANAQICNNIIRQKECWLCLYSPAAAARRA